MDTNYVVLHTRQASLTVAVQLLFSKQHLSC